jgi:ELWxxDGT repeat protein/VCBS repeat-containing protein
LTALDGVLFFTAFNIDDGEELWRSDGTEEGTTMVKDILTGSGDGTYGAGLTVFEGMLFFAAEDNDHGIELWRSDGTESGTVLVADISSGTSSSLPEFLTAANGLLYFAAQDNDSGTELWQTDGSAEGTIQVADLFFGTRSSAPHELFDLNDTLLFAAEDGAVGVQLWTLEPKQIFGTITGRKFEDLDADGIADTEEPGLEGLRVFIDANDDGQWESGERSTITDTTGHYSLQAPIGLITLRATRTTNKIQTVPLPADHYSLTVEVGQTYSNLDFGEATLPPPMTIDLLAESDQGVADDDDITNLNNRSPASVLQFRLTGIATTGEVHLYASGTLIGSTVSDGSEIVLTTDGQTTLPDGIHEITAVQRFQGIESDASIPLIIQIDSEPPSPIDSIPLLQARVGQPFSYDVNSDEEQSPNTQYLLADAPTGMTIDSNGMINWTPNLEQAISESFQVLLRDTAGNATSEDVRIEVLGTIPAYADTYEMDEDTLLDVTAANGVLANDGDDSTGPFLAQFISGASHGELTFLVDGSFSYKPQPDFHGTDSFLYTAIAGDDISNIAKVTITVRPTNDAPVGTADVYETPEDTELNVDAASGVLTNDQDIEGDSLTAVLLTKPAHGSLQFNEDGSFRYTPAADFFGDDSFAYAARDGVDRSDTIVVSLTVAPVNDAPIAEPDAYSVNEDGVLTVTFSDSLLDNDSDVDGDSITSRLGSPPSHGKLSPQADGTFVYEPEADFVGSDSFTYIASDGTLDSMPATVTLTVNAVADPPQAIDDSFEVFNDQTIHQFAVLVNDSTEPDGQQTLQLVSVTQGSAGEVSIVEGEIQYTLSAGYVGTDTFTYMIEDADGLTDTGTVMVEVIDASVNSLAGNVYVDINDNGTHDAEELGVPGVLITLTGTTNADETITRTVLTLNDGRYRFNDLPAGTYQLMKSPAHAMQGGSVATTVPGATVGGDQISEIVLAAGQVLGGNDFAELHLKPEYLSIAWFFASSTPQSSMFREMIAIGEEHAGNNSLAEEIRNVDQDAVLVENHAPLGTADDYQTDANEPLSATIASGVLANDVDSDDDPLMAVLIESPDHGTVTLRPNGSFSYAPDGDFTGDDSFTYQVVDGFSQSSPVTAKLQVLPIEGSSRGTAASGFDDAAEHESHSEELSSDLFAPQWIDQAFLKNDAWF